MGIILDENDYERMAAHQRAASRAAVSRADENERLRERIKELEAELERWKPRSMETAPRDGTHFWVVYEASKDEVITRVRMNQDGTVFGGFPRMDIPMRFDFICWFPIPNHGELAQIGGAK